jgi:hypothetical protein
VGKGLGFNLKSRLVDRWFGTVGPKRGGPARGQRASRIWTLETRAVAWNRMGCGYARVSAGNLCATAPGAARNVAVFGLPSAIPPNRLPARNTRSRPVSSSSPLTGLDISRTGWRTGVAAAHCWPVAAQGESEVPREMHPHSGHARTLRDAVTCQYCLDGDRYRELDRLQANGAERLGCNLFRLGIHTICTDAV